jgi:hypothetical protein
MTSKFIVSSEKKSPFSGQPGMGKFASEFVLGGGEILTTGESITCTAGLSIPPTPEKTLRQRVKNIMHLADNRVFIGLTFFMDFGGRCALERSGSGSRQGISD